MKKNELGSFIVYVGMLAIVLLVSILVIRPALSTYSQTGSIPGFVLMIIAVLVAVIFNALLLEQGHLVGALLGGYKIISWTVLGLCFSKVNGKLKVKFSQYEGLTGETKILPTDTKKNSMSTFISFPLLAFLVEVVLCVVLIAIGKSKAYWLYLCAVVVLSVGGVIYLYDYFPTRLDVENDGYRMTILNKPINKEAYNDLLIAKYNMEMGKGTGSAKIYEDVTNFTCQLNLIKVYEKIKNKDFSGAIVLLQKTIDSPNYISGSNRTFANVLKLTLVILTTRKEDGITFYKTIDDATRSYIQELSSSVALRAYILIQGVIDGEFEETKFGLEKAKKIMKNCPDYAKDVEITLYGYGLERIQTLHPTWDLKSYVLNNNEEAKHE